MKAYQPSFRTVPCNSYHELARWRRNFAEVMIPSHQPGDFTAALVASLVMLLLLLGPFNLSAAINSATVKKLFANPPREYATAPLWVWNDMLTEQQIVDTMRSLAAQQVKQVFVHPRPGMMTPYLSDEWFKLWKVALKEADRLDMNVWIYDENSYPSGFAGGWVPELMPESRGRGLYFSETNSVARWADNYLGVYRLEEGKYVNVSSELRRGEAQTGGRYLVASMRRANNSPWHGNRCYVDLLYPGVTEKFLEVTLEAYRREIGAQFGKRVPGAFTDEPELRPAGGMSWTEDLPKQFQQRWDYSILEHLPSLQRPLGDWQRVRHNYYQTLLDLFIERWAKPYFEYCAKNNLEFTGHYWEHEWPNCGAVPDNMAMSAWMQRPGIDTLMNQYQENTHAQFGNVRACREVSSVANQLGYKRTLVELYGAGGWDLRFEDMKRIGDWLQVLGINTMDEHLSYVTLRGARKRDHPQSFSYHEPWWEAYHVSASYLARLSAALSQGEQINRVLVLEPTTTAWMYQGTPKLKELGDAFFNLLMALETAQVEYDLGCEDVLARHGAVAGNKLVVGRRQYDVWVLPPFTENLNTAALKLLQQFHQNGGPIIACGPAPARVDGAPSDRVTKFAGSANWKLCEAKDLPAKLKALQDDAGFVLTRAAGDKGILFHHRRQLNDGELLLLVNTSLQFPAAGTIEAQAGGVEKWDLGSGNQEQYGFENTAGGVRAKFELPPSGSLLLFLDRFPRFPVQSAPAVAETATTIPPAGRLEIAREEPNVLTLDYVDITAGGETKKNIYFYQANQFAFQKNGLARNPWDSAVQFKDELITKTFAADSGFEASYRFTIEETVPAKLFIVIERPDLYTITCNGSRVSATKGQWWLDKAFGKIDLVAAAKTGENVVTIKAAPFTMYHELEPAYLLGEFTLKASGQGFVVRPDQPLQLGKWNEQGHPFYAAGVAYRQQFKIDKLEGQCVVELPGWYGSVARVNVNGKTTGYIGAPPWRCEVTKQLKRGLNTIEVTVIGTLKNTLGPHHGRHALGSAWPSMFQNGPATQPPGNEYSTVGYGLFEPFGLKQGKSF